MATTAGNFLAHLRTRLRSTGTVGISDAFGYTIISSSQLVLNAGRGFVIASGTFTYTSGNALYTLSAAVSTSCARLISLYGTDFTVQRVHLGELSQYDKNWYGTSVSSGGGIPNVWSPIGEEMIAIYPKSSTGGTLSCTYIKATDAVSTGTDTLEIADSDLHFLYDLCEIAGLAHMRQFAETRAKIARLRQKLGL